MRRAAVIAAVLATCGYAAASPGKDPAPFEYRFQVTAVVEKSTFVKGDATAVTELHLAALPKAKSIDWYGRRSPFGSNGTAAALLHLTGTITYTGLERPECDGVVRVDSTRWARPSYAGVDVATGSRISATTGGFPFGTIYPRRNGGCESGATRFFLNDWPKPDRGPGDFMPFAVVHRPSWSFANTYHLRFEDGSSVRWSVAMTVRSIHYLRIDCARTPWC
jgi:hypothetical protein